MWLACACWQLFLCRYGALLMRLRRICCGKAFTPLNIQLRFQQVVCHSSTASLGTELLLSYQARIFAY